MGNDGSKSSGKNHHQRHRSKDDDEIELPKPQRRMDKIRRSLSFRKKKNKQPPQQQPQPAPIVNSNASASAAAAAAMPVATAQYTIDPTKPTSWQDDERKVRDGTCSFHVKYLGSIEVFESRGMHICEQAIERLLTLKKKPIKAILYVSGDSLRVVDETNKTLLVDQTIEKVSFCAPDRFHDNGFAYICRDGTTRRWLCHGFLAIKDTIRNTSSNSSGGERLSHAVGCAFSVCLERKQKRENVNVTMEVGANYSFTRLGSFRQASLTERLEDPQIVIPAAEPTPIKRVDNPYAIERPKGNVEILQRQNSLRSYNGPFKRNTSAYTSLKPGELPSFQAQKLNSIFNKTSTSTATPTNVTITTATPLAENDNKINTINELPEENFITEINSTIASPTPPPLPPLPSAAQSLSYRSTTSSVTSQPPPLPPLPNVNNTSTITTNQLEQHHPFQSMSPPPSATQFWNEQAFTTPNGMTHQQSTIFATPQSPLYPQQQQHQQIVYNYPPQYYQQQPFYATPTTTTVPPLHTTTTTPQPPANETFEAKWARLQASKKTTNPFAEDIAKKYEIKL